MYKLIYSLLWLVSKLPFAVLYAFSDLACLIVSRCYRTEVVRQNLRSAFPEKSDEELKAIERGFYHQFCDNVVEVVKMMSMSKEEMKKRMAFSGVDTVKHGLDENQGFVFVYLSHFGNWEWVSSLAMHLAPEFKSAQIYHRLYNKAMDRWFYNVRSQYGGENVEMKKTLRRIMQMKKDGHKWVVGFISDQQPKWNSIHHFTPFLNHDTAVFTGTEQIARKVDACVVYGHMTRVKRGYYHMRFETMHPHASETEETFLTDRYMQMLEENVKEHPEMWLWSHKRWSRTKDRWIERQNQKQ